MSACQSLSSRKLGGIRSRFDVSQVGTVAPNVLDLVVYLGPCTCLVLVAGLKVVSVCVQTLPALAYPVNSLSHTGNAFLARCSRSRAKQDLPQVAGESCVEAVVELGQEAKGECLS
eukprot:491379-Rhodomonas_salina.1